MLSNNTFSAVMLFLEQMSLLNLTFSGTIVGKKSLSHVAHLSGKFFWVLHQIYCCLLLKILNDLSILLFRKHIKLLDRSALLLCNKSTTSYYLRRTSEKTFIVCYLF
jgi:hypothetical protein